MVKHPDELSLTVEEIKKVLGDLVLLGLDDRKHYRRLHHSGRGIQDMMGYSARRFSSPTNIVLARRLRFILHYHRTMFPDGMEGDAFTPLIALSRLAIPDASTP
jgi:hypothetical protein